MIHCHNASLTTSAISFYCEVSKHVHTYVCFAQMMPAAAAAGTDAALIPQITTQMNQLQLNPPSVDISLCFLLITLFNSF